MNDNASKLLEKYIEGKDMDRYEVLEKIYLPSAVVSFEIKADNIEFPGETHGNVEIAKLLSAEFNRKYDLVKTYYLANDFPEIESLLINNQNWLVVMRERKSGNVRIGAGYYNWKFENQRGGELKIKHHKIFIFSMLELPGESLDILYDLQQKMSYPWVTKKEAVQLLQQYKELDAVTEYLQSK